MILPLKSCPPNVRRCSGPVLRAGLAVLGVMAPGLAAGQQAGWTTHPALQDRWSIQLGLYTPNVDTSARLNGPGGLVGTEINFEEDLGYADRKDMPAILASVRLGERSGVVTDLTPFDRDNPFLLKTQYSDTVNTAGGVNYNSAGATHVDNGTCGTATACHNNDSTGGAVGRSGGWDTVFSGTNNCVMCHSNGTDAVADAGGADSMDDQRTVRGHGAAAGGNLDEVAAGSDDGGCDFCHLDNVWTDHLPTKSGTNPYRLRINQTTNDVCLACHGLAADAGFDAPGATATTIDSSKDVEATHDGLKHAALEGGMICWDCHEAHGGGGTNILMIKDYMSIASDTYGKPTTTTATAVVFTARAAATDFVDVTATINEASSGICQKCHDNPAGFADESKWWRNDGSEDGNPQDGTSEITGGQTATRHNQGTKCTTCHAHKDKFAGSGCNGCHGGDVAATGNKNFWPDGITIRIRPNRPG